MKVRELTDARNRLPEILDRASSGRERFLIRRRGRPVAAIVSTDDLDNLERDKPSPTGLAALAGLGLGDVHRGGIEVHGSWPRGQHRVRYLLDTDTISTTLKAAPPRCLIE